MALNSLQFLDSTIRNYDEIDTRARELLSNLTEAEICQRISPDRWSIAQCLEHLMMVNDMYIKAIGKSLNMASRHKPTNPPASASTKGNSNMNRAEEIRHSLFARMFIASLAPPPKFKMPAPGRVKPEGEQLNLEKIKANYFVTHDKFREFARTAAADGIDLQRTKVVSPISSLVKLSLAAAFDVCVAHENRHLWQGEGVKRELALRGN